MSDSKKKNWLKRGLALLLAITTILATSGINPGVFAAGTVYTLREGKSFSQVFESNAPENGKMTLTGVTFGINSAQETQFMVHYDIYMNTEPSEEGNLYTASTDTTSAVFSGDATATVNGDTATVTFPSSYDIAYGEYYTISIMNSSGNILGLVSEETTNPANAGGRVEDTPVGIIMKSLATTSDSLPNDVTSIELSGSKNAIAVGEDMTLDATLNSEVEGRKRNLTFTSTSDCVTLDSSTGELHAVKAGKAEIRADYGSVKSNTYIVYVCDTALANPTVLYKGSAIDATDIGLSVTADSTLTKDATDGYTVTFSNNENAGTGSATVTGTGIYAGLSTTVNFTISQVEITSDAVSQATITAAADGTLTIPDLTVNGRVLKQDVDFTATASNPVYTDTSVTYDVTVAGINNYTGNVTGNTATSTYSKDNAVQLSSIYDGKIEGTYTYTGSELEPTISLYNKSGTKVMDIDASGTDDISVKYTNNKNAGTATATLTGTGEKYAGTITVDFTIDKRDLVSSYKNAYDASHNAETAYSQLSVEGIGSTTAISAPTGKYVLNKKFVYTGDDITFKDLTLKIANSNDSGKTTLTAGSDYKTTYNSNSAIDIDNPTAKLEIVGKGNYRGKLIFSYYIIPDFAKHIDVTVNGKTYNPATSSISSDGMSSTITTKYETKYDGTEKKIVPTVTLNDEAITEGNEYSISYENNVNAGEATLKLTGLGDYDGKVVSVTYKINPIDLSNGSVNVGGTYTYNNGEEVVPADSDLTVKASSTGNALVKDQDYSVKYSNNKSAGTAKATITGQGNYTGTLSGTYTIGKLDISAASVNPTTDVTTGVVVRYQNQYAYTGSAIVPDVTIYNNNVKIYDSTDSSLDTNAKVTASNNIKVGNKAKINIAGADNLTGSISGEFKITKRVFDDLTITVAGKTASYNKSASSASMYRYDSSYEDTYTYGSSTVPEIVIVDNGTGKTLSNGSDYTVSIPNRSANDNALIYIYGTGAYQGSNATIGFKINPRNIVDENITITQNGFDSTEPEKPVFTVVDKTSGLSTTLTEDKDYKVVPVDEDGKTLTSWPTEAGLHYMKVTGTGNYTGETEKLEYERGTSLAKATISLVNPGLNDISYSTLSSGAFSVPYIGNNRPKEIIKVNDTTLESGTDYSVKYDSDDYSAGTTVTVTVTAKSGSESYYGETKFRYTIRRLSFVAVSQSGLTNACYDYGSSLLTGSNYFCGDQGVIVVSDGNAPASGSSSSRVDYNTMFNYFYAHQGSTGGYDALTPNVKMSYYALGSGKDPIVLSSSDITISPSTVNVDGVDSARTYKVSITGNGNYADTLSSLSFKISQSDIQNATVSGYDKFTSGTDEGVYYTGYTGSAVDISNFTLKEYGATLKAKTDYTISKITYSQVKGGTQTEVADTNVLAPGYYTITYKGTGDNTQTPVVGNYYGEKTITFKVTAREFNDVGYSISGTEMYVYTGNDISTGFTIKEGTTTLTPDAGYDVAIYKGDQTSVTDFSSLTSVKPKEIGIYTVVFTGKNKYTGTLAKRFKVVGNLSNESIFSVDPETITGTYSASALASAMNDIKFTYNDPDGVETTVGSTEYTAKAADWTGVGTGAVTVTGNAETASDDYLFIGKRTLSNEMKGNLADATVVDAQAANGNIYSYTGASIKPSLTVTYYGQELKAGRDFEIKYVDTDIESSQVTNKVGEYDYYLYGKGNFEGQTAHLKYYVEYNLKNTTVQFADSSSGPWVNSDDYSKEITGDTSTNHPSSIRAILTLSDGDTVTLKSGVDFDLTYSNDSAIGNVSVKLTPKDKISYNEKTVSYNLIGKVLTNANTAVTMNGVAAGTYNSDFTGSQITPVIAVVYGGTKTLTEGVDFTTTYGENVNAGDKGGTVTIKGIGQYSGTLEKTFTINQVDISTLNVSIGNATYSGSGVKVKPEITINHNNYTLVVDTDYTVDVGEPSTTATETLEINGTGNFKGNIKDTITLQDRDISMSGAVTVESEKVYDGAKINTKDVVLKVDLGYTDTDGKEVYSTLKQGTEYTVTAIDSAGLSANVGDYSFVINAVSGSHFTGQITKTVSIVPKDISEGEIEASLSKDSYDYTGSEVTPTGVTAVYNTTAVDENNNTLDPLSLVNGTDYDLSYANNTASQAKDADDAPTVILTGKGNYTGTRKLTFNIGSDLSKATVDYTDPNFTYNGKEHGIGSISYAVKAKNTTLTLNTDYSYVNVVDTGSSDVHYKEEDVIHAGTKTVTLQGMGAYYGKLTFDYHIKAKTISKDSTAIKIVLKDFTDSDGVYTTVYDGSAATSEIEVYDIEIDKDNPIDTTSWELYTQGEYANGNGYKNNTNVSASDNPAMVAITMKGDYDTGSDTLNQKFYIKEKSIDGLSIELKDASNSTKDVNADRYPYDWQNNKPIKPEVLVHEGSETLGLVEGTDYTLSYEDNDKIGTAKVVLKGKGNYTGEIEKEFIIYASLENADITLKAEEYYYLGYGIVPTPAGADKIKSVKVGGVTLDPKDYVVTESSDNHYQTSGSLSIIPSTDGSMAPYLSKVGTKDYTITSDLSKLTVSDPDNANFPNYEYTGSQITPKFIVTQPDGSEIDYDKTNVKYYKVTAAGDVATTELVEKGNYKAEIPLFKTDDETRTLSVNFNITNPMINASDINMKKTYVYNGDTQEFTVAIYKGSNKLKEGTDYSLTVMDENGNAIDPVNCGNYYLKITGMGEYEGSEVNYMTLDEPEAVSIVPDRTHSVKVSSVSTHQIYLQWTASNDVTGYVVTVTKKGEDDSVSYKTSGTNYTIKDLEGGTKYVLEVKPYIYDTVEGEYYYGTPKSVEQRTRILAPDSPSTDATTTGKVTISWSTSALDIDGYEVYRSNTINGTYSLAAVVPLSYASYTDTMVTSGKTYYYRLRSYKIESDGTVEYSSYSQIVEAKAP